MDSLRSLEDHDLTRSLCTTLAGAYGRRIDHAEQTVWAESADEALAVGHGAPLMVFRRTSAAGSRPVEHVTSWYQGERHQIHRSLERSS